MEKFIPLDYYSIIYYNVLLFVVMLVYFNTTINEFGSTKNGNFIKYIGFLFVPFITLYIGLRPLSPVFIDMTMYAHLFNLFAEGANTIDTTEGDYGFLYFLQVSSKIMTVEMFFLVCAMLYVLPLVYFCRKFFREYWFYGFLMLIISFSFLGYAVNGIRNGIATSLFLFAVCFHERKVILALLLLLSLSFHKSMSLPIGAFCLTYLYNDMRTYLKGWFAAIPISLILGGIFVSFFTTLGFDDARVGIYLSDVATDDEATGFRWDFILYSATGIFAAWFYIIKKGYQDVLYQRIVNVYIIANLFWILIIRAGFSNRFAYLSWFLLAVVIIYPLIKVRLIKNQHSTLGKIVVVYYMFTYLINFLFK